MSLKFCFTGNNVIYKVWHKSSISEIISFVMELANFKHKFMCSGRISIRIISWMNLEHPFCLFFVIRIQFKCMLLKAVRKRFCTDAGLSYAVFEGTKLIIWAKLCLMQSSVPIKSNVLRFFGYTAIFSEKKKMAMYYFICMWKIYLFNNMLQCH